MVNREEVTNRVTVLDVIPGEPAFLLIGQLAARADGNKRTITQKVRVLDDVFSRIRATVSKGDEIEVTIVTEWSKLGYASYMSDFCSDVHDSELLHTPTMAAKAF